MARAGTIARRSFLIGSAAITGGVAFGVYLANRTIPNPLLENLGYGEAAITPFVKITSKGITLVTPRADKGQGSYSIQAYLIAEELDVDPLAVDITPGVPGPAYYNSAVLSEGIPIPAYETNQIAETLRDATGGVAKILSMQMTGGSSTVPDMFTRLREAGAVARETLKQAASNRLGVSRADLSTKNGAVITPDGQAIHYTDLAADAAKIDPIRKVTLRPKSEWKRLGKRGNLRTDIVAKSTGREVYGIDFFVDGMVFASICANPGIGGALKSYDDTVAKNMPGVQKIVEVKAGNAGVAVVASNTWYAIQAANAIECEWGEPDYPASSQEMWDILEAAVDNSDAFDHRQRNEGDVDSALAEGDVFEAQYRAPFLAHAPMEPMNAIVRLADGQLDIWTGTQIPLFVRNRAATIAGLDKDQVHVHVLPIGGSFGHRLEMTHVEQAVEVAMAMDGTPVKFTWSREEDMTHDYPRPASVMHGRGKVVDGKVDTYDISVAQQNMAGEWFGRVSGLPLAGPDATITTGSWDQPFAIRNYRVTGYKAPNLAPVSSWRSVGASANGFFHDTFLDELIHEAGADPLEERIRLCLDETSRKVLEMVGEISGWNGSNLGENRGRGIGFCLSFGVPVAQVLDVTMTDAGIKLDKAYIVADIGQVLDPTNAKAQLFGGMTFGLAHAINSELTYENYAAQQDNYHVYEGLRLYQVPEFEVKILENSPKIRGVGEPGVPPAAPALGNAIFAATGQRLREMPFNKFIDFV